MKKLDLSVVIIARNESEKIADSIKSVIDWVNEILVVDNLSTDNTSEISKKLGARIITAGKEYVLKYSKLRNLGLKNIKSDWVLYLDADERIPPKLRSEIEHLIENYNCTSSKNVAFIMPRCNVILGREMKHGGWWPDYVKRLFISKYLVKWEKDLHEEPIIEGEWGTLENPLIHLKHNNLSEMVEKTNKWSVLEAKAMFEANHPPMNVPRFISAMAREFWLRMVKHRGFLDGPEGVIYSMYQVFSRFISYAKLWEMQLDKQK